VKPLYQVSPRHLASLFLIASVSGACAALAVERATWPVRAEARVNPGKGDSLTQKKQFISTGEQKMGRPVVHFEIGCRDSAKAREFYARLFDWQIDQMGPAAAVINTGASEGIQGHITSLGHEPHNYVTVYVQVEDLKAALEKAASLGGKTLVPPVPIPTGQFAWMSDPEGNLIGLLQPKAAPAK
jgi:uncharacterized protein